MKKPSAESLLADIRAKCLDCCCGSRKVVAECRVRDCRLWPHRLGNLNIQTAIFPEEQIEGQMDIFDMEVG